MIVSWEATTYVAEKCRQDQVKGSIRNLLWAIAYLVIEGERETAAVTQATLVALTGDSVKTVQRAIATLTATAVGLLRVHPPGGKGARYELAKMHAQGVLFGVRSRWKDVKLTPSRDKVTQSKASTWRPSRQGHPVPTVEVEDPSSSLAPAARVERAHSWLEAFGEGYAAHHGTPIGPAGSRELDVALALLERWSSAQLLEMAHAMWRLGPAPGHPPLTCECSDCWIARAPEKGVFLLNHKAAQLAQRAAADVVPSGAATRAEVRQSLLAAGVRDAELVTWFDPCHVLVDACTVTLVTTSDGHRDALEAQLGDRLRSALERVRPGARLAFMWTSTARQGRA